MTIPALGEVPGRSDGMIGTAAAAAEPSGGQASSGDTIPNFWLNWLYDNGSLPGRC